MHIMIVGGGLAGLVSAILLARDGITVTLAERKTYPFHRVCGEYISNEVKDYLVRNRLVDGLELIDIKRFTLTSPSGRSLEVPLQMGGFGISRYELDHHLFLLAQREGVHCLQSTQVKDITFEEGSFKTFISKQATPITTDLVLGCYGKHSNLDKKLERGLEQFDQGYIGVKYHIKTDFPSDTIALHQFKNGYCGISKVGHDRWNLCYLARKSEVKRHGGIDAMEKGGLSGNPYLKGLFANSDFLLPERLVINQFGFYPKTTSSHGVIMLGDAAGSIPPLAGNGMAMAIHSAKLFYESLRGNVFDGEKVDSKLLGMEYSRRWKRQFGRRLWTGRRLQSMFGHPLLGEILVGFFQTAPQNFSHSLIRMTHGQSI